MPLALSDPRLDPYRDLKSARAAARSGRFIAEGRWLVQRLLSSSLRTESVAVERRRIEDVRPFLKPDVELLELPDGAAAELVGFNFHRGVLACGWRPQPQGVGDLIEELRSGPLRGETVVLAGLAGVQDPENLGGVIRNAAAFGAAGVILGPGCADPYSRRVLRVSMGNVFRMRIFWSERLEADLPRLQRLADVETLATVLDRDATPLADFRPARRSLLLLGEEGYGLPATLTACCARRLTIPMAEEVDSLNVATAGGIFLHHLKFAR